MKKENYNIKSVIIKSALLCLVSTVLTVGSVFTCNLINGNRVKNAFENTFKSVKSVWSINSQMIAVPRFNAKSPFTVNAQTNIKANTTANISASFKPESGRLSAQAVFRSSKGETADIYAYCTKRLAGISLDGNNNTFYTVPASDFKKITGYL